MPPAPSYGGNMFQRAGGATPEGRMLPATAGTCSNERAEQLPNAFCSQLPREHVPMSERSNAPRPPAPSYRGNMIQRAGGAAPQCLLLPATAGTCSNERAEQRSSSSPQAASAQEHSRWTTSGAQGPPNRTPKPATRRGAPGNSSSTPKGTCYGLSLSILVFGRFPQHAGSSWVDG